MDLLVLCPTRGRPAAAREAYAAFCETKVLPTTEMQFVVDDDDPSVYEGVPTLVLSPSPGNMASALNGAAMRALETTSARILGFVGDDHRFRTPGWDEMFTTVLDQRGGGLIYGDDGFRPDGDIPTQVFISSTIVRALGWMALPKAKHLYLDNAWRVLGDALGRLFYMPDVLIEHMHPAAGKAEWSPEYERVNAQAVYDHDAQIFADWLASGFAEDVERARAVLA